MKKIIYISLILLLNTILYSQETVRIFGHVTDFNNNPLDSVLVILKNKNFENLYQTLTNKSGYFSLNVPKGFYYCIYAIKPSDYGKTKLEYWAWNIPALNDFEINPKYDRLEIYGMNAFEPQVGPFETYMIYFRPMSLTKVLQIQKFISNLDTLDIAPKNISSDELKAYVNDIRTDIVNINKVLEYGRGKYLYGYLIQIIKPINNKEIIQGYDKISIILNSKETNEYGMGECFIKKFP
ncbi:carboxypeptidase-like regulatory domain-containing protein [Rosettibacter firmus]|uniref:carboxypeptidase-like regulatory domain-containing protein n=1 Tax=Rosettibacter firmus TaxID=3111522 RepID=UPI00336C1DD9